MEKWLCVYLDVRNRNDSDIIWKNLDLAQIEAIVQEIEREKEAGKLKPWHARLFCALIFICRGGEETDETGGYSCRASVHDFENNRRLLILLLVYYDVKSTYFSARSTENACEACVL